MTSAHSLTMRSAMGLTAMQEYPPGTVYPSTVGSGRSVSRSTPVTQRIVLIAETPSHPADSAASAPAAMLVTFGVSFAQTGILAADITQPQTSRMMALSCPIAAPILRSGNPCGQEKFNSNPATPVACTRSTISIHASLLYSSMIDAMTTPSGYLSLSSFSSSSQTLKGRSEISSMFCQPTTSLFAARSRA